MGKTTKVKFADDTEIKSLSKELTELQKVMQQRPSLFTSDGAPFWYHGESSYFHINLSALNFYITRLTIAYEMDFSAILGPGKWPTTIEVLKYIKTHRGNKKLAPMPEHLIYWCGITNIRDEVTSDPELQDRNLTMIISMKEQLDYHKGLAQTDEKFATSGWEKEYDDFLKVGKYVIHYTDGTTKEFKTQEDIYYYLIAECSNNPKFRYDIKNSLN